MSKSEPYKNNYILLTYIELVILLSKAATFMAIKDWWDWAGVLDTTASNEVKKDVCYSRP